MTNVTIAGTAPDALLDVDTNRSSDELGDAVVVVGDTPANRDYGSGDRVEIDRPGGETWTGYVIGKPTQEGEGELEIKAMDTRYEMKQLSLHRVFYNMDAGDVVKAAVEEEAEGRGEVDVHGGSDMADWSSDFEIFELAGLSSKQIHQRGSDLLFCGLPEGSDGDYSVTFTGVPTAALPGDGQLLRLETRLLVNDPGNQITGEVELRDFAGNQYVWPVEYQGTDFNEYELKAEEAEADGRLQTNGALEYRFGIDGALSDNVGIVIDWASAYPFTVSQRDTNISTAGVEQTGRTITRRCDKSALELVQDLEEEEGFSSWIDEQDVLYFEPAGGRSSDKQIVRGETPVTEAKFNTDFDAIVNRVTVRGNPDKDVQITLEDPASINYYGVSAREKPIVDETIQTNAEAEDRGRGFLEENAWGDTVAEFEVGDSSYQDIRKGSAVYVDWPPRNLNGYFVADEISSDSFGITTVSLGVRV